MSYAIRKDLTGWRRVDSAANCTVDELYSETEPVLTLPAQPDPNGFAQAVKTGMGGILAANALMVAYPAFFPAIQTQAWVDVQALVVDAKAKSTITTAQYNAIKGAAATFNIPVTL